MDSFPVSKLNRAAGEILDAAIRGPIELTHRGRRRYVLMPVDYFDRIADRNETHHINIHSMSDDDRAMLLNGLADVEDHTP
jgi:antitoxin Phd